MAMKDKDHIICISTVQYVGFEECSIHSNLEQHHKQRTQVQRGS
ncbi:unnamed protein product [Ixodes pacificus]